MLLNVQPAVDYIPRSRQWPCLHYIPAWHSSSLRLAPTILLLARSGLPHNTSSSSLRLAPTILCPARSGLPPQYFFQLAQACPTILPRFSVLARNVHPTGGVVVNHHQCRLAACLPFLCASVYVGLPDQRLEPALGISQQVQQAI